MFRSPHLEALFGKRLDQISFADVHALVGREEAAEAADLDYKELVHARNNEQKVEFCKDVVAMANDRGGILIIGVREDGTRAIPKEATKVDVTDGEQRRLGDVLLNTAPHPLPVDIVPLEDPDDPGRGVLLVLVERSALAPHAVLDTRDKTHHRDGWLRFPIRNGAATRWMLEPEVATRYRDRHVHGRSVQDRLDEVEVECLLAYEERDIRPEAESESPRPVLAVTIVPEIAGRFVINRAALLEFQRFFNAESVLVGRDVSFQRTRVAPGKLIGIIGDPAIGLYAEFHTDGSGSFVVSLLPDNTRDGAVDLLVQDAIFYLLSGLRCLGRHARDRAGATGVAAIRLSLLGGIDETGGIETAYPQRDTPYEIKLTSDGDYGEYVHLQRASRAVGDAFAPVDDLAADGPGLVSAAAMVANEACHAFGLAEVPLLDVEGTLILDRWGRLRPTMSQWARSAFST